MEILFTEICKSLVIGFFIGGAIGLTGIGGGVLVMPSLIYLLGVSPVPAVGTGLLFSLFAKITGIIEHYRLRNIDIKTAVFFTIGSAPTTLLGSHFVNYLSISGKFPGLDNFLEYLMGSILIVTAILLVIENIVGRRRRKSADSGYTPAYLLSGAATKVMASGRGTRTAGEESPMRSDHGLPEFTFGRKAGCIVAGALVGTLIGATSIGGGVLVIPILMVFFGLSAAITVGTSILISIVPIVLGGLVYTLRQNINLPVLLPMFLGSLPGVVIASRLTRKIPQSILKAVLIIAIFAGMVSFFWGARR